MSTPPLPAARISWSDDLRILGAEGDCVGVLGHPAEALRGRPLPEVLGLTHAETLALLQAHAAPDASQVGFVRAKVNGAPRWLRLGLGEWDGARAAWVVDLEALLVGAPPLQLHALAPPLSHQLRNPLSSVKMAVQMMARNADLSERDARRIAIADREVRTLERMLCALAEYGRERPPALEARPLRALVDEATALIGAELAERGMRIELHEAADLPEVLVESGRLRPLLAQLLLDATGTPPEGGALAVHLSRTAAGVQLIVEDHSAVPASEATLFEPFGAHHRAGLTLPALRRVMAAQNGAITARGEGAAGLVFTLTFSPA